jgi:sugar transferase (PEP-CTERM/EpsH1 system associated)
MHPLRILFVTPYVPSRLRPRPFHFVKALAERGHRVVLVSAATSARELAEAAALTPLCERVHIIRVPRVRSLANCLRALATSEPLQAHFCRTPVMTAALRQTLSPTASGYDVIHIEHLRAALYGAELSGAPRIYDAVDCMTRLLRQTVARGPTWSSRAAARIDLQRTHRFERDLVGRFDRVLVTAAAEREALLDGTPPATADAVEGRMRILRNGVDLEYFAPQPVPRQAETLVFVGRMGYHANLAAAQNLVAQIMPRLWQRRPAARLVIVGADPPRSLRAMCAAAGPRVALTGYVADVRPFLAGATVSVNPLGYAVGVQNKILEAMAMGTPVVATSTACAALDVVREEQVLIADTSDELAAAAARLLDDPALAARIGAAGRRLVEDRYDWRAIGAELEAIYRDAMAERRAVPSAETTAAAQ